MFRKVHVFVVVSNLKNIYEYRYMIKLAFHINIIVTPKFKCILA